MVNDSESPISEERALTQWGVPLKELRECFPCWCVSIDKELLDIYGALAVPHDMLQQPLGSSAIEARWTTSKDAEIIRDLLDMAGIPIDEQGGNDADV